MPATIRLPLTFDPRLLHADLDRVAAEEWMPHYNKNDYEGQWRVAGLRTLGGSVRRILSSPAANVEEYSATPLLVRCPYFQQVLAAFECPVGSARLMSLGAGSQIREHSDSTIEYKDNDARLHIPVATNPAVEFYLARQRVVMNEGETWYLDFSEPHSVVNAGTTDRVHLVLDCVVNDWLRELLLADAAKAGADSLA